MRVREAGHWETTQYAWRMFLARIVHDPISCKRRTPLRQAGREGEGKEPLRRAVIERGGTSKLGLAGRFAIRELNILFQRCLSPSGLRVPVSRGVLAVLS